MPTWRNSVCMPKVRASSATIGTMRWPSVSSLQQLRQQLHEHHGGGLACARPSSANARRRRSCRGASTLARRQVAAERLAPRMQVLHLRAVGAGLVEAQLRHVLVRERQREAVAECEQRLVVELLLLVGAHLALAPVAHAVALLGLREDHRGLALVLARRVVGGIDLHRVVAAAAQAVDVVVAHAGDQLAQLRDTC